MRRSLRTILGIVFIVLGVVAALTPFSPGSWLALIGLEILGLRIVWLSKAMTWLALIGLEILGLRILLQRKFLSLLPDKYRDKVTNLFKKIRKK